MTDAAAIPGDEIHEPEHHGSDTLYLKVFGILVVCTVISFLTVMRFWVDNLGETSGHTLVMLVAVFKATLVAMFFMHLRQDWFRSVLRPYLYLGMMVVGALIMGTILICALLPDQTFSRTRVIEPGVEPTAIGYEPGK
jgi:caa(3)-type oxidase subunit IV